MKLNAQVYILRQYNAHQDSSTAVFFSVMTRVLFTSVRAYCYFTAVSQREIFEVEVLLVASVYGVIVVVLYELRQSQYPPIRSANVSREQPQTVSLDVLTRKPRQAIGGGCAENSQEASNKILFRSW